MGERSRLFSSVVFFVPNFGFRQKDLQKRGTSSIISFRVSHFDWILHISFLASNQRQSSIEILFFLYPFNLSTSCFLILFLAVLCGTPTDYVFLSLSSLNVWIPSFFISSPLLSLPTYYSLLFIFHSFNKAIKLVYFGTSPSVLIIYSLAVSRTVPPFSFYLVE